MRIVRHLYVLLLMLAPAWLAQATVVETFDSRAEWEAATTGRIDIDFESLGLGTGGWSSYSTGAGLTTGGITFVGVLDPTTFYLYALNPPLGASEDFGSSTVLRGPEYRATSYLNIILPALTTSIGLDLMTFLPDAQSFVIQLDGVNIGEVITTASRPTRTFFGVTTDSPISEVRIVLNSGTQNLTQGLFDNVAYGTAAGTTGGTTGAPNNPDPEAETPEVATMVALGSGLLALRWLRTRQVDASPA